MSVEEWSTSGKAPANAAADPPAERGFAALLLQLKAIGDGACGGIRAELGRESGAGGILADIADAATPGEWNSAVARLVGWAVLRGARAEGHLDPTFRIAVSKLSALIAGGFVPRAGRPSSAISARHDAMILEAEGARTMPDAVAALRKWYEDDDPKTYNRWKQRAKRAAAAAGIELSEGVKFGSPASSPEPVK